MSKSFEFCKTTAQDSQRSTYANRSWDNAVEDYETEAIFDEFLHGSRNFYVERMVGGDRKICYDISISFDCDANFDYFTSDSCIHDGTLYFIKESMNKCVRNVCFAQTYNKNIGEPKHGDHIHYVVGNFVVLSEYDGDFVPSDKPWMRERTTVLLPLKMTKG